MNRKGWDFMKKLNGRKVLCGMGAGTGIVLVAVVVSREKRKTEKKFLTNPLKGWMNNPKKKSTRKRWREPKRNSVRKGKTVLAE